MPIAEILSQGDEVVTGQVADTNAQWLSDKLTALGFQVRRHTGVLDDLAEITALFRASAARCDLAICTGGLGPTEDDLTARAVADAFSRPLAFDDIAMAHIEALYARFQRTMPEINRKQAWLPQGALRLDNDWGTAPGFAVQTERALMAFVPGVPREMKQMFDARILPLVQEHFAVDPGTLVTLRTTGIGESALQERLTDFTPVAGSTAIPLSFRTKLPENHLKLRFPAVASDESIAAVVRTAVSRIGSPVFGIETRPPRDFSAHGGLDPEGRVRFGGSLIEVIAAHLAEEHATLAVAESCTGGSVAALCTSIPGASTWFLEGAVCYSNASKMRVAGVPEELLFTHGAVSEPVARALAEGIRDASGATWGLSTTGIAGPSGGTTDKPVGTVHIAVAGPHATLHRTLHLSGNRRRIQSLAVGGVLDLLRRQLQGL